MTKSRFAWEKALSNGEQKHASGCRLLPGTICPSHNQLEPPPLTPFRI